MARLRKMLERRRGDSRRFGLSALDDLIQSCRDLPRRGRSTSRFWDASKRAKARFSIICSDGRCCRLALCRDFHRDGDRMGATRKAEIIFTDRECCRSLWNN